MLPLPAVSAAAASVTVAVVEGELCTSEVVAVGAVVTGSVAGVGEGGELGDAGHGAVIDLALAAGVTDAAASAVASAAAAPVAVAVVEGELALGEVVAPTSVVAGTVSSVGEGRRLGHTRHGAVVDPTLAARVANAAASTVASAATAPVVVVVVEGELCAGEVVAVGAVVTGSVAGVGAGSEFVDVVGRTQS